MDNTNTLFYIRTKVEAHNTWGFAIVRWRVNFRFLCHFYLSVRHYSNIKFIIQLMLMLSST